jgi:branched-chain amino acid transport system ATP-binding protein
MLELDKVRSGYGSAIALWDVSLHIGRDELVCVVGPNGAGKTTLINTIAGLNRVVAGSLSIDGKDLGGLAANKFCDQGIAIVPEGRRLFTGLSVLENLELGSYRSAARRNRRQSLDRVLSVFPMLHQKLAAPAGTLSGGQQQMVAIGRAMMAEPRLLLLDEPSLGLAPSVVLEMFDVIRAINRGGVGVLLVEQNVAMAMDVAARAYVLEEGRIVAEGLPTDLLAQPQIRRAYLGEG